MNKENQKQEDDLLMTPYIEKLTSPSTSQEKEDKEEIGNGFSQTGRIPKSRIAEGETGKIPKVMRQDITGKLPQLEEEMAEKVQEKMEIQRYSRRKNPNNKELQYSGESRRKRAQMSHDIETLQEVKRKKAQEKPVVTGGILNEATPKEKVFRSRLAEGDTGKIPKVRRDDVTGKLPQLEEEIQKKLQKELELEKKKALERKKQAQMNKGKRIAPDLVEEMPYVENKEELEEKLPQVKSLKTRFAESNTGKIPQVVKENITGKLPKLKTGEKSEKKVNNNLENEEGEANEVAEMNEEKSADSVDAIEVAEDKPVKLPKSRIAEGNTGKIPQILREDLTGQLPPLEDEPVEQVVAKKKIEDLDENWADEPYIEQAEGIETTGQLPLIPIITKPVRTAKSRVAEGDTGKIPMVLREDVTGKIPKMEFEDSLEDAKEDQDDWQDVPYVEKNIEENLEKKSPNRPKRNSTQREEVAEETHSAVAVAERPSYVEEENEAQYEEQGEYSEEYQEEYSEEYQDGYEEGYGDGYDEEFDQQYQEGDVLAQVESVVRTPQRRVATQEKKKKKMIIPLILATVFLFSVVVGGYMVYSVVEEVREQEDMPMPDVLSVMPDEGAYIDYLGMRYPVFEDVPMNVYDGRGFFSDENGYIRYEVDGTSAIAGVDVSYHQQNIDWEQVAEAGFEFAMIRAGRRGYGEEGSLAVDTEFDANMRGAVANGMDVGVYFFSQATNMVEVIEETAMVLELIESYDVTYPVVFDWEFIAEDANARTKDVTGEEITEMAAYFCKKVEEAGYIPSIYFNMDMAYRYLDLSELKEYPFWLAELTANPRFYYHFDMWQYTFTGVVPGISTDVDLNLSFRDFAAESAALKN